MLQFTILSLILLGLSLLRKDQKYVLPIVIGVLFLILGFRAEHVGTDTTHYRTYFNVIRSDNVLAIEPGWIFLNKAVAFFGGSFEVLLVIVAFFTLLPVYNVSKRSSLNPMLSIFLYFTLYLYFYSFNISRQTLAVSIVLLGYVFLEKGMVWKYVLAVIGASLFHTSALVVLPLVFVHKIPDNKYIYFLGIIVTSVIGLLGAEFLYSLIPNTAYAGYFDKLVLGNLVGNGLYLIVLNCFFFFIYLGTPQKGLLFKIFYVFILLSNLLVRIPLSNRILMYLAIVQIIFLPYFIYSNRIKVRPLLTLIIIIYAYIIFFRSFGSGEILPYSNILLN